MLCLSSGVLAFKLTLRVILESSCLLANLLLLNRLEGPRAVRFNLETYRGAMGGIAVRVGVFFRRTDLHFLGSCPRRNILLGKAGVYRAVF